MLTGLVMAQYALTAVSSGFNAGYFLTYRFFLEPEHWFQAHIFLCLSSLLITILILRQLKRRGKR
jgi:hypothetical protein